MMFYVRSDLSDRVRISSLLVLGLTKSQTFLFLLSFRRLLLIHSFKADIQYSQLISIENLGHLAAHTHNCVVSIAGKFHAMLLDYGSQRQHVQ